MSTILEPVLFAASVHTVFVLPGCCIPNQQCESANFELHSSAEHCTWRSVQAMGRWF